MDTQPLVDQAFGTSPSAEAVEEPLVPQAEAVDQIQAAEGEEVEQRLLECPRLEEEVEEAGHRKAPTRPPLQCLAITGKNTEKSYKKKETRNRQQG